MSTLTDSQLNALYQHLPDHSHLNYSGPISLDDWADRNRPYLWRIFESVTHNSSTYQVALDSGHGCMALFLNDTLIETTFDSIITTPICVVMDPYSYNLPKALWF